MARKPPDSLILGEGPIAAALKVILKMPLVGRRGGDAGWNWPKGGIADRSKVILVAAPHSGADRIVRHHAEVWKVPWASRMGVIIVAPDRTISADLLNRDVFGRKESRCSRFGEYSNAIRVLEEEISLVGILSAVGDVGYLLVDTWRREAKNASCIPPLLDAIVRQSAPDLERALIEARNVHWDSICSPNGNFANHHAYANSIRSWLESVTPGVTPDWNAGLELIEPLAKH
jgi:hypothetical protein